MSILEVSNVSKSFGGVKANVDISMNVEKRENCWFNWAKWIGKNNII
jgi:ABC-type branched-subunit amino acid transport system ATPase component